MQSQYRETLICVLCLCVVLECELDVLSNLRLYFK